MHDGNYGLQKIDAPLAWEITTGPHDVQIGVLDRGISNHPDLNNNLKPGYNFVDDDTNTSDTGGHGTHVAGIM